MILFNLRLAYSEEYTEKIWLLHWSGLTHGIQIKLETNSIKCTWLSKLWKSVRYFWKMSKYMTQWIHLVPRNVVGAVVSFSVAFFYATDCKTANMNHRVENAWRNRILKILCIQRIMNDENTKNFIWLIYIQIIKKLYKCLLKIYKIYNLIKIL